MSVTVSRLLAAAWSLFRRERSLLIAAGAPFLFLPPFAVQLLIDGPPLPFAATQEWMDKAAVWAGANVGWYLLADVIVLYGMGVLALLLVAPERPNVAQALTRALRLLPRFVLAGMLAALAVGAGMYLLILPGLYLQARLVLVPLLIAAEPLSATRAIGESWRRTAPLAWPMFGAVVALFALQWLGAAMLVPLDSWLRQPSHANPFVLALVDGGLAAVLSGYRIGLLVLAAIVWRGLSRGT
ncbi:hypothetical protein [Sphingomonas sp.]|uniref:hypothetical protein n=1 Tax=Sphingomonas sp. TaxID=28214 RepID=UPI0035C7933B